jgi:lysophospholipase L1-like esterase
MQARSGIPKALPIMLTLSLAACASSPTPPAFTPSAGTQWVRAWETALQAPDDPEDYPAAGQVNGPVTIRQTLRVGTGGDRLIIRISNRFGAAPLAVGGAHIALLRPDGTIDPATDRPVRFGGNATIVIPAGAPAISDPVDLPVASLNELAVSFYLPGGTGPTPSLHLDNRRPALLAPGADQSAEAALPDAARSDLAYYLQAVDVEAPKSTGTLVAFGDSITDGMRSSNGQYHTWPDRLADRLAAGNGPSWTAVLNAGISGNQLLAHLVGPPALDRFERDVLAAPGLKAVILLEGANDILALPAGKAPDATAEQVIGGYRQLIARAHERGIRIIGATLTPLLPPELKTRADEPLRRAINDWIRKSGAFDGVVDFDAAVRDPARPDHLRPDYDSGDHLHPNDRGYDAMAEAAFRVISAGPS